MCIKFINKFTLYTLIALINLLTEINASTTLTNLNFNSNEFDLMTGREIELKQIQHILKNKHRVSIGGLPGVGKSYLAMFFATTHQNNYDIVWVINCKKSIYKEYRIFAQAINSNFNQKLVDTHCSGINLINSLKEFLRKTKYKWLIIYDNYIFQEEYEQYFPVYDDKKNYLLLKNSELSDLNLREMPLIERTNLFSKISNINDINQIKEIITTCRLNNTAELVEAAKKRQRSHPVILANQTNKSCILPAYSKNKPIHEIIARLKTNFFSSYQLINHLAIFGYCPVNLKFIKEIYLLNTSKKEPDFYNDIDVLISKHLLYYERDDYVILPGVIQKILLNSIITNQDQDTFKRLCKGLMWYIKSNIFLEHQINVNNIIYDHIYNIIDVGKNINCNKEIIELYFILIDYHIKFDRNLQEINNLLQKVTNSFDNKNIFIQTKIKYLSKLSNYYFMLGQLKKSLKIEKDLNKLLRANQYIYNKKEHEYDIIFNKIMLLKIYANMGDLQQCESINIPQLEASELEVKLLYLKAHYMEVKSYIKYLKSDLVGALNDINNSLFVAFDLAKKFNAEANIYYTCAHLFSKKYLYMFELGLDTHEINDSYYKIYTQAINKSSKSVASIKMIYGYIKGNTENLQLGIDNIKYSINIYNNLYEDQNNKNLSTAHMLLGDLYCKKQEFNKAEKSYVEAINILKKCYTNYKTHDYKALLKKLIMAAKINSNYILLKHYYKDYLNIYGDNDYDVDNFSSLTGF